MEPSSKGSSWESLKHGIAGWVELEGTSESTGFQWAGTASSRNGDKDWDGDRATGCTSRAMMGTRAARTREINPSAQSAWQPCLALPCLSIEGLNPFPGDSLQGFGAGRVGSAGLVPGPLINREWAPPELCSTCGGRRDPGDFPLSLP